MAALTFDNITPDWLTDVLYKHGSMTAGKVDSLNLIRSTSITALTATIEPDYSSDARGNLPAKLFFKRNHRASESQFYSHIASQIANMGVLTCYDSGYDNTGGHLLLEYIEATHFAPPEALPMQLTYCEMIVDLLADLHAQWWEHPDLTGDIATLAEDVPGFVFECTSANFGSFVDYLGDRLSDKRRGYLEKILAAYPTYRSRSPKTLVHGDTHWWNFLYPHDPTQHRLYLIDWAVWHVSVGVNDLAYTLATHCYPERRSRIEQPLIKRYYERLLSHGIKGYSWEQCYEDYRRAVIDHCLWPTFWYSFDLPNSIWWAAFERVFSAFEDLNCQELL